MRFALVGNPNSGKTTLFNRLTGSNAKVGNWPGVTVDIKEGRYRINEETAGIIDLPGIYSLFPYTQEEVIAKNYIIDEKPDLIINIVDATNLERNLYLTTQILETDIPVVVALNLMEQAEKNGVQVDISVLEKSLGVPVLGISALTGMGIKELMEIAFKKAKMPYQGNSVLTKSDLSDKYNKILKSVRENNVPHPHFAAARLLEEDFDAEVADARYRFITKNCGKMVIGKRDSFQISEQIDMVMTNKYFGIPVFFAMMMLVFHCTFSTDFLLIQGLPSPGILLRSLLEQFTDWLLPLVGMGLESLNASPWAVSLVVDGILNGIMSILSFLPQILLLFLFLSIMEDSGYMSRAAFIMDRLLRKLGLSGKAFIPMIMGFGCTVPAILATRTLENEKSRKLTIMLMSGFSCGAKLPVWTMIIQAFHPDYADLAIFAVYLIGIVCAILFGLILQRILFKDDNTPFIMELPNYRVPQIRNVALTLWEKMKGFVLRAATLIAASAIVLWFLTRFDFSLNMLEQPGSAESILGIIGSTIRPIFIPLGFANSVTEGWKMVVSIFTGLVAKESIVSTMSVLFVGNTTIESGDVSSALNFALRNTMSVAGAWSFMIFNLLTIPCVGAVSAAISELRSKKWTAITLCFWFVSSYIVAELVYFIVTLFRL